jgi:hypothetical protein
MTTRILIFFVLVLAALPACATDFAGPRLLIPIAGRTSGALGSQWTTDLYLTNAARSGEPQTAEIYLMVDGYLQHPIVTLLNPRQTAVVKDVIGAFGKSQASGMILIAVRDPNAKLTARARIYNSGSAAGQYGQTVPAMPITKLAKESYLPGLSGVNGNRTNIGITNPEATPANIFISLFDQDGEFQGAFSSVVPPYGVQKLDDVFSYFQAGALDNATIQIRSSHGVYAFGSIVRGDSGDADFVAATGTEIDNTHALAAPQCASPSTLSLAPLPADGWTVVFKPGVNAFVETPALAARLGITADQVYEFGAFYSRVMTPEKVAALRCEGSVRVVEQNTYVPVF